MINQQLIFTSIVGTALVGSLLLQPSIVHARASGTWSDSAGEACIICHSRENPGLYREWNNSQHGQHGVNCYDCHKAKSSDKDAFTHHGKNIAIIVSPKDCGNCHEKETEEFERSYHSRGGQILPNDANNVLGVTIGGHAAAVVGCEQCHGSKEITVENGKLTKGWPNTGIGRHNPDGSWGACTACHGRHGFSRAQARTPESCAKCHIGPDHPQLEVYKESMHGIIYYSGVHDMNLDSYKWVAGVDYSATPTCVTCHMGAAPGMPKTHDLDERLSVNLRAKISHKINLVILDDGKQYDVPGDDILIKEGETYTPPAGKGEPGTVTKILTWKQRRNNMKTVCKACHSSDYVNSHYENLDNFVALYNNKFAKPVAAVMDELLKNGILTKTPFDEWLEWLWWEIWHHEGRRARSGAGMGGPDYAWWLGIYDVAKRVYMEFIPELIEEAGKEEANRLLEKHFKPIEEHNWYFAALEDTTTRDTTLSLGYLSTANGKLYLDGGTAVNDQPLEKVVQVAVGSKVEIRAKIISESDKINFTYDKVKVFFTSGSNKGYLSPSNGTSWTVDENNYPLLIWQGVIPESFKGQTYLLEVEYDDFRFPKRIEVTVN